MCEQVDEEWVWQSTHVGGDRFAGNLVALPDGVFYGRVGPSEAWPLLECALRGQIHLPTYRGRSCHSFPVQAAERAVRELTGMRGVADVRLVAVERAGQGWSVELAAGGSGYAVDVRREEGEPTHLTCSTAALSRPRRYVAGTPRARAS